MQNVAPNMASNKLKILPINTGKFDWFLIVVFMCLMSFGLE
jgi:hypothetical protein